MIESQLRILTDPKQKSFHETAALELLRIWDELYRKDPKRYSQKSIKAATRYLNLFPQSKNWEISARRLAEYYTDANDHSAAVKVLEKICDRYLNKENFWRLKG